MADVRPWTQVVQEFVRDNKRYAIVSLDKESVARKGGWSVSVRNCRAHLSGNLMVLVLLVPVCVAWWFLYSNTGGWYTWAVVFTVLASQFILRALVQALMLLAGDT